MTKPIFPDHAPGCCPENYDEETGACRICGQTYDPIAWQRHLKQEAVDWTDAQDHKQATAWEPSSPPHDHAILGPLLAQADHVTLSRLDRHTPNPVQGDRHCLWCDELFPFKRSTAIYCSTRCRVAAMREEKRHRERDCPRCNTKNGQLIEHHCANVLALDRVFNQRMRQGMPRS